MTERTLAEPTPKQEASFLFSAYKSAALLWRLDVTNEDRADRLAATERRIIELLAAAISAERAEKEGHNDSQRGVEILAGQLAKLEVKPGDQLVLMTRDRMTPDRAAYLSSAFEEAMGGTAIAGRPIVLEESITLGVIRPVNGDEASE